MPKPIFNVEDLGSTKGNDNDSGMHTSISLWEKSNNNHSNTNTFYDENDDYAEISQIARYFTSKLLSTLHGQEVIGLLL